MTAALLLFLAAAQAFWQARPPADWTRTEAQSLLRQSPWAAQAVTESKMAAAGVPVLLLTALPVRQALQRIDETNMEPTLGDREAELPEWRVLLRDQSPEYIALGVELPDPASADEARESAEMQKQTSLRIGKRRIRPHTVFPAGPRTPWTIFVFPRPVGPAEKVLRFELFIPGPGNPFRAVEFKTAALDYQGRPEF
jgi:hypothetical protein